MTHGSAYSNFDVHSYFDLSATYGFDLIVSWDSEIIQLNISLLQAVPICICDLLRS